MHTRSRKVCEAVARTTTQSVADLLHPSGAAFWVPVEYRRADTEKRCIVGFITHTCSEHAVGNDCRSGARHSWCSTAHRLHVWYAVVKINGVRIGKKKKKESLRRDVYICCTWFKCPGILDARVRVHQLVSRHHDLEWWHFFHYWVVYTAMPKFRKKSFYEINCVGLGWGKQSSSSYRASVPVNGLT